MLVNCMTVYGREDIGVTFKDGSGIHIRYALERSCDFMLIFMDSAGVSAFS